MIKILLLLILSSCSYFNPDYWKVRSTMSEYQDHLYKFDLLKAQTYLTKSSQKMYSKKDNKQYSDDDLANYKKLAKKSSFSFKSIEFKDKQAIVIINETIPDYEQIFTTMIAWHMQKLNTNQDVAPLNVFMNQFIETMLSQDDNFYLINNELTYLLVKEDNKWKIKLD